MQWHPFFSTYADVYIHMFIFSTWAVWGCGAWTEQDLAWVLDPTGLSHRPGCHSASFTPEASTLTFWSSELAPQQGEWSLGWTSDSLQALPLPPKPYSFTVLLQKNILWAVAQGQYVNSIVHRVNHNCKPRALEWKVVCRGPAQTTRRIFCRVSSCHRGRDILKRPLPSMSDRLGGTEWDWQPIP